MRLPKSVLLLLCGLVCAAVSLPASKISHCAENDEDCREKFMHPNMPSSPQSRKLKGEETSAYWLQNGIDFVQQKLATADQPRRGVAKNVIFFLGDGMSLATLAATRVYLGGEELSLSFEQFTDTGLAKTYALDRLVPDSACTATAYLCGTKAMYGTIGVNGHVSRADCKATKNTKDHVDSIAKWALDADKSAGVVTTARITDASPAAVYAHTAERDWENDAKVAQDCGANSGVQDIALQLIKGEVGSRLKVVLGGGKREFIDKRLYAAGKRSDGRNLIDEFLVEDSGNIFIESKSELKNLQVSSANRVLGLFNDNNLLYHLDTDLEDEEQQPTLAEMTRKAIELLQQNPNGYFAFIEGALIDKAHHNTRARLALDETAQLSEAVALARALTNEEDTLIVVSSDHAHAMSFAGYASRSSDIFDITSIDADDELPYRTLSYANGPSYYRFFDEKTNRRVDPEYVDSDIFPATAPTLSATHGGEDVPVFASGPWSLLFTGAYEQSTIPHMLAYAACLGDGQTACD